jgi:signal transduction histidine kinase
VALKMDTHWLARGWTNGRAAGKCQGMGRLIDTAVDNVGRIITDLRPSILDHQGLWAALEWQAQEFIDSAELGRARAELQLHVAAGVQPPEGGRRSPSSASSRRCCPTWPATCPRPRADAHRGGRPARPGAVPDVRDDGVGAAAAGAGRPAQLRRGGHARAGGHFGGKLTIDSAPGQGTRVRLVMPLDTPAEAPA